MTESFLGSSDTAELLFGLVLIAIGIGWSIVNAVQRRRESARHEWPALRVITGRCEHPAWRVTRDVAAWGVALRIKCYRCEVNGLDLFGAQPCGDDGSIMLTNLTPRVMLVVINNVLHEMLPAIAQTEMLDGDGEYALIVPPVDRQSHTLRKR